MTASAAFDAAERSAREAGAGPLQATNVPCNGIFTFSRVRYTSGRGFRRGWSGGAWAHDCPAADRNMQTTLNEFTALRANTSGSNLLDLEDREIFRNPILYVSEPGFWSITPEGAENLREFLPKGGFHAFRLGINYFMYGVTH